jgi:hypothetical protein
LEWGDDPFQHAWLAAHNGIDLTTGRSAVLDGGELPPVVRVAMEHLTGLVNHSNGLVSSFDKDLAITTLQALVRGGYRYEVDELCSWALAHGFTGSEVRQLRDYAAKVLTGHKFRLSGRVRPRAGPVEQHAFVRIGVVQAVPDCHLRGFLSRSFVRVVLVGSRHHLERGMKQVAA